ncbi:MAG: BrnT family toxin [Gammaproteobacteria bacterium]|nr:BrnT family toxin [Gammaproteobacteria bacterium]
MLNGRVVFMVWVEREHGPHLISVREATRYEQRYYFANIGF